MFFISCLIYVFLASLVGIVLIGISLGIITPVEITSWSNRLLSLDSYHQIILGWTGIVFVLSCINFVRRLSLTSSRERTITLSTEKGNIKVSLLAIEEMIRKDLSTQKVISHIKPKVNISRKGIKINIRATLNSQINLSEFTAEIQEEIKRKLSTLVGDREVYVDLEIKRIAINKVEPKEEEKVEIPFRNY